MTEDETIGRWARDASKVWRHPEWAVTDVPEPEPTGADLVVRVRAAGIATSTLRMTATDAEGYVRLPYRMSLPLIPGHEFAGEVVDVGPDARGFRIGDAVAAETLRACGRCAACRRGRVNACLDGRFAGFNMDGGLAEFALVPSTHARSLESLRELFPGQLTYEIGALCEPAAVSFVALFETDRHLRPGMSVAVFGCGPIGLAAVALARCAGATSILAFDPVPERRQIARRLGADQALPTCGSDDERAALVSRHTRGRGFDVVVDASGSAAEVLPAIQHVLAAGGHVVHLGVGGPAAPYRPISAMAKGASHSFSMGHLGGFDPVIALHAAGRLDLTPVIGSRRPLEDGVAALAHASERRSAKTLVVPGG
ncbi:alcohol dehydrogenase catalytic domain-containing protein [Cryptosporangium sp. NPDC051539]|uniref:alcohol dehydrogenase catalytic domain-containing protein n=1 Tax=Cryptosporangium sp. NPDC051539 TaxID=3363962 RepID=UPI00379F40C5